MAKKLRLQTVYSNINKDNTVIRFLLEVFRVEILKVKTKLLAVIDHSFFRVLTWLFKTSNLAKFGLVRSFS